MITLMYSPCIASRAVAYPQNSITQNRKSLWVKMASLEPASSGLCYVMQCNLDPPSSWNRNSSGSLSIFTLAFGPRRQTEITTLISGLCRCITLKYTQCSLFIETPANIYFGGHLMRNCLVNTSRIISLWNFPYNGGSYSLGYSARSAANCWITKEKEGLYWLDCRPGFSRWPTETSVSASESQSTTDLHVPSAATVSASTVRTWRYLDIYTPICKYPRMIEQDLNFENGRSWYSLASKRRLHIFWITLHVLDTIRPSDFDEVLGTTTGHIVVTSSLGQSHETGF